MQFLLYHCFEDLNTELIEYVDHTDVSTFIAVTWNDVLRILRTVKIDVAMIRMDEGLPTPARIIADFPKIRFYFIADAHDAVDCNGNIQYIDSPQELRSALCNLMDQRRQA